MGGRGAKVRRFTIGKYGKLTVEQARKKAELLALEVANSVDPQLEKMASRARATDLAFDAYVKLFTEKCLEREWVATHKYVGSLLTKYAVPVLRSTPLPDITRRDIRQILEQVSDKVATASNLFAVLRRLFSWAVEREDIDRSPLEGMRPPPKPPSRERVLSDEELALVWRGADALGYPFGPMVQLLILTGARREEVAALDWSELDRAGRSWALPAARSKNAQSSENALSSAAVELLDGIAARSLLKDAWRRAGFLFSTTGTTSVSGYSRAKRRLDKEIAVIAKAEGKQPPEPWRLHDLRRTLATGLQRLGVRFEVTEAVLNHVSGSRGGVAGIYQRHDWKDEKRAALEAWAQHVNDVLNGAGYCNLIKKEKEIQ
jgi:integrase